MALLRVEVSGLGEATTQINKLRQRFQNLRPFWRDLLVPLLISEIIEVFRTEGRGTWPPLSPAYAARKRRLRPGKTILRYDDHIIESLSSTSAHGNVFDSQPQEMTWGLDPDAFKRWGGAPYPIFHELGTSRLPKREIFNPILWGGRFESNVESVVDKWADDQARELGLSL